MDKLSNFLMFKIFGLIRVRDLLIVVVIIVALLLFRSCSSSKEETEIKKETPKVAETKKNEVIEVCKVGEDNVKVVLELLNSAEFCSNSWYKNIDALVLQLKNQNKELSKDSKNKKVVEIQEKLIKALENFRKNQDKKTIEELEKIMNEYVENNKKCEGENKQ